jgi:hypothetical protein
MSLGKFSRWLHQGLRRYSSCSSFSFLFLMRGLGNLCVPGFTCRLGGGVNGNGGVSHSFFFLSLLALPSYARDNKLVIRYFVDAAALRYDCLTRQLSRAWCFTFQDGMSYPHSVIPVGVCPSSQKNTPVFRRGVEIPPCRHTTPLVEIRLRLYFQNNTGV